MTLPTQFSDRPNYPFKKQLVLVCSIVIIAAQTVNPITWAASNPQSSTGAFVSAEHPTAGTARVVQDGTKRYLVLDKAFRTDAGPDLFVILHRAASPKTYAKNDYVLLGALKSTTGEQRYEIPATVDPKAYQSVVIWCRQFSATFGYAKLTHGKM